MGLSLLAPAALATHVSAPEDLWSPAPESLPAQATHVYLESTPGDWVGAGRPWSYDPTNAVIEATPITDGLDVRVQGDTNWRGRFVGPTGTMRLRPGYYHGLTRYPFHDPSTGGLDWFGDGRGCNGLTGWFVIDEISYSLLGSIDSVLLRFEQRCDGGPPLWGQISFDASQSEPQPDNPITPPPDDLWEPDPAVLPDDASTFVHLESTQDDWIGQGRVYDYRTSRARIDASRTGELLTIAVEGDERWSGLFAGPDGRDLRTGYYEDLQRYPFHNPVRGGLSWWGEARGCNKLTGWFVIDELVESGDELTRLRLRFEQRCDGGSPLRGLVVVDTSFPPEPSPNPAWPAPQELWEPDPAALPDAATFVHLESTPGDWVGAGSTYDYRTSMAEIDVIPSGNLITVNVDGNERWNGRFAGTDESPRLEPGYYADLQRYPFHNARLGGLDWSGEGRGCNRLAGWFVVDEITYDGDAIATLRLRFEQRCELSSTSALRGLIVYDASAPVEPSPNPHDPPPDGLWEPTAANLPPAHTFVHLDSAPGDYIASGTRSSFTPEQTTKFDVVHADGRLSVALEGDGFRWGGVFAAPDELTELRPGFYGNLLRYPFHNPRLGGLSWSGNGRGCNELFGWFVVDDIEFVGSELLRILLRFEQRCELPDAPPLHGVVAYSKDGTWPGRPPETYLTSPLPSGRTTDTSSTFEFAANEALSSFQCSQDDAVWTVCTSPHDVTGLEDGQHTFRVRAIDSEGATDPTPASATWVVDTTPPDTLLLQSPPADHDKSTSSFSFSSTEEATFTCRLDDAAWAPCTSPVTYEVSDGTHRFFVRATDLAGNVDPSPISVDWTVDTTTAPPPPDDDPPPPDDDPPPPDDDPPPSDDPPPPDDDPPPPGDPILPVTILGGPNSVSENVAAEVTEVAGSRPARQYGPDRYATATSIVRNTFVTAGTVYIATGESFPDALAGSAAAAQFDAPVLLTSPSGLPDAVATLLDELRPHTVKLLGGPTSIPDAVAHQIAAAAGVTPLRIAGGDRYETAAAIAADAFSAAHTVYLATGETFPDALAGSAAAARADAPVLLTTRNALPSATAQALARLRPRHVKVLGGPNSVSDHVIAQVEQLLGVHPVRVAGADRYETAAAIVADAFPKTGSVYLATGASFPDALAGSAAAARRLAPVLLTQPDTLPTATRAQIGRLRFS